MAPFGGGDWEDELPKKLVSLSQEKLCPRKKNHIILSTHRNHILNQMHNRYSKQTLVSKVLVVLQWKKNK